MKQKRLKKYEGEDSSEIRNLIIITVIIALIATGLYFLTEKVLNKKENNNNQIKPEDESVTFSDSELEKYVNYIYFALLLYPRLYRNNIKTHRHTLVILLKVFSFHHC